MNTKHSNRRAAQEPKQVSASSAGHPRAVNRLTTGIQRTISAGAPFLAGSWLLLAVLEVALLSLIPATALRNHEMPLGARLFLLCYALTVLNLFLILIGASLKLLVPITQRLGLDRKKRRWLGAMLPSFALGLILLVYAASWAAYWQIGSFIDSRVFLFMAPHPLQVFHWVDRDAALAVLALAVALTIVTRRAVPALLSILSPSTQTGIVRFWVVASLACLMGTFFGELYSGWGQRQYMRAAIAYRQSFDNATGPLPFVLTEIRRRLQSQANNPAEAKGIDIVRRPIVPMDQYLASAGQSDLKRWNVVLLIVESLRADQLRIYGGARDVMPTVDALAQESQVFLDAFTQSSHTNYATVVPFSSHYPLRSATPYNNYPENPPYPRVLIYDILKALGYKTGMFSSSNEYWGGMTYYFDTGHLDRYLHAANFDGPTYVIQSDVGFAAWVRRTKHAGSINDRLTVDEAMRWLDGLEPKNPFFLSVTFQSSHLPYPVPPEFRRRFAPDKLDFKIRFGQFPRDRADIAKDLYADSLAYVDNQIARLFEHLKRQGLWDRTLIVVTSDHGQAFFEHGFVAHGGPLFNEVMKVPVVIRAPGLAPALKDRPAQHVDIPPTILGLIGLRPHPSFQGIDLLDSSAATDRSIYMVAQTPTTQQYGMVRSKFKLIYDELQQQYSLYDLQTDPGENFNIAASQPIVLKDLSRRLLTWRRQQIDYYSDETLHKREYPPILAD